MIHSVSVWAFAVVISSICSTIVAHFVPVDLERREICVENTIYLALQEYIYDADPWCRTELGIVDVSSIVGTVTARTTTTLTKTTTATKLETVTVPSSTVTITRTPSFTALSLEKRKPIPKIAAFQRLSFIQSINDGSASEALYADVITACKCLRLQPRIEYGVATVSVARTLRAVDYRETTSYVTVTAGVATEFTTPSNVTLVIPVKPVLTSLGASLPTAEVSSVANSNLSLISTTTISVVRTSLVGTGLPLSPPSTRVLPSNIISTVTVSPIPSLAFNLTRPVSGTGLPFSSLATGVLPSNIVATVTLSPIPSLTSNLTKSVSIKVAVATVTLSPIPSLTSNLTTSVSVKVAVGTGFPSLKISLLSSNNTKLATPTVGTPPFDNSTLATPTPSISLNTTYILPLPTRPAKPGSSNATTLCDYNLIIRDPQLPEICQSLYSNEINTVKTVLSTIVSTSVRTAVRTSVTTSIITSVITSVKTAIIPRTTIVSVISL